MVTEKMVNNMRKESNSSGGKEKTQVDNHARSSSRLFLVSKSSLLPETRLLETRSQSSLCVLSFREHLVNVS